MSNPPIPIFIICRDRLKVLEEAILSYAFCIDTEQTPISIVLHDNNSTYEPMVQFLIDMEESKECTVYRTQTNELNSISNTITHYMQNSDSPYYIVTDPDIKLDKTPKDILLYYIHLLNTLKVKVVGPMLRIDDIPNSYPLKNKARMSHIRQFWSKEPHIINWKGHNYHYLPSAIDTTFGMYRRGFKFKNLNTGVRTYAPYIAKHLDWYLDPKHLTPDQKYYAEHTSTQINHWSRLT